MGIDIASSSLSFWQSTMWESLLHDSHQADDVIIFSYGIEAIMIEFRSIGLGMRGAFSLGVDMTLYTEAFLKRCRVHIARQGAILWQIEEYHPGGVSSNEVHHKTYGRHFLEPWTRTIDLSLSEETILAGMHEKGRYNIRLAWKRGVTTQWVDPTLENIGVWMDLLSETTARDGFSQNSEEYYISFLQTVRDANAGGLLFALYEGQVIAAGIFVYYHKVALYYYGASTSDGELRKHMAPYLIQWEALREAKLRGCATYDFLGVVPPDSDDHHLAGVSSFKEKFGGNVIAIGSKKVYILGYIRYFIFTAIRRLRSWGKNIFYFIESLSQKD